MTGHDSATCPHQDCQLGRDVGDLTEWESSRPVGATEIAALLGVKRDTVVQWQGRGVMPAPDWTVGGRPAWRVGVVLEWARETGRRK